MIFGSHNTFTYLRPRNILGVFGLPCARCQSKNIDKQINNGVRCFDIRVRFDKKNEPYFAHGLISFKGNVCQLLEHIARYRLAHEKIIFRMTLETKEEDVVQETLFVKLCEWIRLTFDNVTIINGRRKFDWRIIYTEAKQIGITQYVGSMQSKYGAIIPWLWWINNKKRVKHLIEEAAKTDNIIITDFSTSI